MIIDTIDNVGLNVIGFAEFFRDVGALLYGAFKSVFLVRSRGFRVVWEILLAQIRFTGAQGVALSAFAALAIGTLIQIELSTFVPSAELVSGIVAHIVVMDVAPLLTALVIIGRSGTAISVELANMKLTGELDALTAMGCSLEHVVVLPRVVGAVISFLGMVVAGGAAALVGGYLIAGEVIHLPFTLGKLLEHVLLMDVFVALAKAVLMGAAISVICIREGFSVKVSQREVPMAATRGVVRAMSFCLVVNTFLSIYG
jgi:phospholipid/cholesterol/gamma-HCH transport system permease protein